MNKFVKLFSATMLVLLILMGIWPTYVVVRDLIQFKKEASPYSASTSIETTNIELEEIEISTEEFNEVETSNSSEDLVNPEVKTEMELETIVYSENIQVSVYEEDYYIVTQKVLNAETDIEILAKVMLNEAGGVKNRMYQAAVAWCILNRADLYGCSIYEVVSAPAQFAWNENTIVREDLKELAKDVYIRWLLEKEGYENVGRVLPEGYIYFHGDGNINYFRNAFRTYIYWDWSLENPYK